jgi:hypothetical protein
VLTIQDSKWVMVEGAIASSSEDIISIGLSNLIPYKIITTLAIKQRYELRKSEKLKSKICHPIG